MERNDGGREVPLTPARRFRIALELFEVAERILRQRLRRARPTASPGEIETAIAAWRLKRPGGEPGDAPGRLRPWPDR